MLNREGAIQAHLNQAYLLFLIFGIDIVDDLFRRIANGTHGNHHGFRRGRAIVVKQVIAAADAFVDLIHGLLHHGGQCIIVAVCCFTGLEENVRILSAAAQHRMIGVQGFGTETLDQRRVEHVVEIVIVPGRHLANLMGCAESVEEVQERNFSLQRGQMSHSRQIHDFLRIVGAQQSITRLTAGHDIGVIAEDGQRMSGQRAGRYMDHAGQLASGNLVHVGDHQQQALGCGKRSRQGAGSQGSVDCAGRTAFGLHLGHTDRLAEQIQPAVGGPFVHTFCHDRRRRDRINRGDFGKRISDMGSSRIAVHRFHRSFNQNASLSL